MIVKVAQECYFGYRANGVYCGDFKKAVPDQNPADFEFSYTE